MIYTFIAYAPRSSRDLGNTYNKFMELLPNDSDWACFLDHDAMFLTSDWYKQLEKIIEINPNAGCFTALTNRIGNKFQVIGDSESHDIKYHKRVARGLANKNGSKVIEYNNGLLSGVLILIKKSVWKNIKFIPGFLNVDNQFHKDCIKCGYKVYLMTGVYVYHWYRDSI